MRDHGVGATGQGGENQNAAFQDAQDGYGGGVEPDYAAAAGVAAEQRRAQRRAENDPKGYHRRVPR